MKRWIFLILAIIIISIFSLIKSCQREKREVINVYTDREIEIFIGKLAKKYENTDKDVSIKINALNSLEDYDIILKTEIIIIASIKNIHLFINFSYIIQSVLHRLNL